jgi:hypothetical protein
MEGTANMKYARVMLMGTALLTGGATLASAQAVVVPVQWGWGHRDNDDRQAFREGFEQGRWDAQHGRRANANNNRWREEDDRRAFRDGYMRGFNEAGGGGFYGGYNGGYGDRDRDWDRGRGGWGGNYGMNRAREFGYQDGVRDGQHDRATGHSYRPTHDDNFKHGDRGYQSNMGNKDYYKNSYRQAYQDGYQRGYNNGPVYRR